MAELGNFQAGLTRWSPRRGTSSSPPELQATLVTIAYELVEPLLNPLLLPEDRALDDFRLAEDILHETAVSCIRILYWLTIDQSSMLWAIKWSE